MNAFTHVAFVRFQAIRGYYNASWVAANETTSDILSVMIVSSGGLL
jgi:hypothetical protein